eukprot:jgi/Tetstr1/420687/TSEL_011772.t1
MTNEYLKQDDRRMPAHEEYLWMSCFGAHMAALFVALDELLPYVPIANQDFAPYRARARNHADSIGKDAGVEVSVAAVAGVAAKVSTNDGLGRFSSELLAHCEATFR